MPSKTHMPPNCGEGLHESLLYQEQQQTFMRDRRLRFCLNCQTQGPMTENGEFVCAKCKTAHHSNLTAPRVFDRFLLLSGRGGGKTLIGAHAAREEMLIPNSIGWVMGPTYKILHDSTFPTLVKLIDPRWIEKWDPEHMEIKLKNGALVAFRSLEDPERARGPHGIGWGWFDEAAQAPERAYDVFIPTLIKAAGIVIASTTVLGYDWTYDKLEKQALVYKEPGYRAYTWWSEENPLFASNPVMKREIDRARRTMSPDFFAQEYKAERRNATGLVYDYSLVEKQVLADDKAVQRLIPEWPNISPSRGVVVGLDSGSDHPFGAVLVVVTDKGLVIVSDYLERQKALSQHLPAIQMKFGMHRFSQVKWAANKNEANLRLEWGLKGVGIIPAENKQEVGIQRVQSWLYTKQLFFAYTCPTTIEQFRAYRYATNTKADGQKVGQERVFKLKDELPDAVRYALMAWPALPEPEEAPMSGAQKARWDTLSEKTKGEIGRVKAMGADKDDLKPCDQHYPTGDMYSGEDDDGEGAYQGIW